MALAALVAAAVPARAPADPSWGEALVVGGDRAYPPYEFLDKDGQPAGFNVDLTRAIAEVMGLTVEIRLGAWADVRRDLLEGRIDALQGAIASGKRAAIFDFSPHTVVHQSVFGRKGAPAITDVAQLEGHEVIVQRNGFMHDYLLEHGAGARLVLVDTHAEALRLLSSGKGDYALVANVPGLYLGRELGLSNVYPAGRLLGGQPYGYAVKKGNEEVLALLVEGQAILRNTGRYQQIHDRWLGPYEPQEIAWSRLVRWAAAILAPLLLVLGATVVWSRTLQKEVAVRTEELRVRQQQLIQADKMASLGILVSGVAHEINNPTGNLLMNLPVLRRSFEAVQASLETRFRDEGDFMIGGLRYSALRDELPRTLVDMQDSANRIKRIVEDLRQFARKDTSSLTDAVDLNAVVEASLRLVENPLRSATRRVVVDCVPALPRFRGNAQRIEQVIVNVLLNACHAVQGREGGIAVRTRYDAPRRELVLVVEDEGVGIPPEHLPHLTDPFFTTKRDQGGTGLGLSISAGIIKEHGGHMEFRSKVGAGTAVTVGLPVPSGGAA